MKVESKATLLKWGPLCVAILALIPAYLMGPIAFTFKATMKDMLNQELTSRETTTDAAASRKEQLARDKEVGNRFDHDLALLRDRVTLTESNMVRHLMDFDARLVTVETQLKRLKLDFESDVRRHGGSNGP